MGNKRLNYGGLFAVFTCVELGAFDLPAPVSLAREREEGERVSCLIVSNAYRSLLARDGSQAASFAVPH